MRSFSMTFFIAVLVGGCPNTPGTDTGTSSSTTTSSTTSGGGETTSSSSTSSTSSGGSGSNIELGALCRELRDGYTRAVLRTVNRCGAAFTLEDLPRMTTRMFSYEEGYAVSNAAA